MSNPIRYATVTDYETLYGVGYFAHKSDSSSFSKEHLPSILAEFCTENGLSGVLDIGCGNGVLGTLLREKGLKCVDVDVTHRDDDNFIRCDFSKNDSEALLEIKARCRNEFDSKFLVTSFDMSEHVDLEHISDFIYNMAEIVEGESIISISTRPSSRANIYHSTILPIDTWKYMFSLVEIEASSFDRLQSHRSDQQFSADTQELLAVSVWQKRNPFQDDPSHQHFLRLIRTGKELPSRQAVRARIESVLDISTRSRKRALLAGHELPRLVYLVSFVQDWAFLRSLLEVWAASDVFVIVRRDFISAAYSDVIEAYLTRVGVAFSSVSTLEGAFRAFDEWNVGSGDLFLTATEGLPTVLHGMASLATLAARKRGATTATLQHGGLVPGQTAQAAQFFIAMNADSVADFERSTSDAKMCTPVLLGASKPLDSRLAPADPEAIAFRLRSTAGQYRLRLLVAGNLHWTVHGDPGSAFGDWLQRTVGGNPDVLFLLRPHPDDFELLAWASRMAFPNLIVLDEISLLCIDWPLTRVLSAVDGVISTHSTLVLDALASGKPTVIFPTGITDERLLAVEGGWESGKAIRLSAEEIRRGALPENWPPADVEGIPDPSSDYVDFIEGLLALLDQRDDPKAIEAAVREVERSFLESCRNLSLDVHPHANRQAVSLAIGDYARAAPARTAL